MVGLKKPSGMSHCNLCQPHDYWDWNYYLQVTLYYNNWKVNKYQIFLTLRNNRWNLKNGSKCTITVIVFRMTEKNGSEGNVLYIPHMSIFLKGILLRIK